jgi:hypothetical protein
MALPLPRSTRRRPFRPPLEAATSYVPTGSGGNEKCPFASVFAETVRSLPDAVTVMSATGTPLFVTVPLRKDVALTAYDGVAHRKGRRIVMRLTAMQRRIF